VVLVDRVVDDLVDEVMQSAAIGVLVHVRVSDAVWPVTGHLFL
jgi:hypothetical protein